jgi:acetyltransferase
VAKLLAGYRDRPPTDLDAICCTLIRLSTLAADVPEVVELDIDPLLADYSGVVAMRPAAITAISRRMHSLPTGHSVVTIL